MMQPDESLNERSLRDGLAGSSSVQRYKSVG